MRAPSVAAVGVAMTVPLAAPALGHSLKELEADLSSREKYFQPLGMGQRAPDFTLKDAHGRALGLADLRGKVVVLNFIYTSCPDLCPLHSERIALLQKMVDQAQMADRVEFVSITTDPERDTPEVMQSYGGKHGLAPGNWVFLTSGPDRPEATRELAARYGQKFTRGGADGIESHGVVTHIIDREGLWRAKFFGLKFDPVSALTYINALANDIHTAGPAPAERHSLWQRLEDSVASHLGLSG